MKYNLTFDFDNTVSDEKIKEFLNNLKEEFEKVGGSLYIDIDEAIAKISEDRLKND